jgi:hypothetical protein
MSIQCIRYMYIQYTRVCPFMVEVRYACSDSRQTTDYSSRSELSRKQTSQTAAGKREVRLWQETETGAEEYEGILNQVTEQSDWCWRQNSQTGAGGRVVRLVQEAE